ncbi:MAG TPA: FKBP-type peptidyl-prolyl cis-trans isomerase [Cyclobacteriaceae bacterium]
MRYFIGIIFIATMAFISTSCGDQELTTMEQLAKDIEIIDKYLADNNIDAQVDPSGLRYMITTEGTGPKPKLSNTVVVNYTGTFLDGTYFDGTTTTPASFPLANLITGWQIGFQLLPEGSTAVLYIPSGLGYGKTGGGPIPPNTNLIFEVELIQVK